MSWKKRLKRNLAFQRLKEALMNKKDSLNYSQKNGEPHFQKPRVPRWPTLLQPQSTVHPSRVSGLRRTCLLWLPGCAQSRSLERHQAPPIANWRWLCLLVSENASSQDPCGSGVTCSWPSDGLIPQLRLDT